MTSFILTPVSIVTISGTLFTICIISFVNLTAPTSQSPLATIVTFLVFSKGAATSAAI